MRPAYSWLNLSTTAVRAPMLSGNQPLLQYWTLTTFPAVAATVTWGTAVGVAGAAQAATMTNVATRVMHLKMRLLRPISRSPPLLFANKAGPSGLLRIRGCVGCVGGSLGQAHLPSGLTGSFVGQGLNRSVS